VASKWSGVTGIAVAILLSVMWERSRRKRVGMAHPVWRTLQAEGFGIVLSLLVLPALVYLASYVGWFLQNGWDLGAWMRLQGAIASYHEGLKVLDASGKPVHPYLSEAWKWVFLVRPVLYYSRYPGEGVREVIYANGNPAIFWGSLLAVPFAAFRWRRRRDWRAGFVVVAVLASMVIAFLAAVALAKYRFTGNKPFIVLMIGILMLPSVGLVIPLYVVLARYHLTNTLTGVILTYLTFVLPFAVWTLRGFILGIPKELEEAAMVDGSSRLGAFVRILLPLVAPGLVATSVFAFVTTWNEYIFASVLLSDQSNQTVTVWLSYFYGTSRNTDWGALMAASTLTAIPVVVFFLLVQRRIAFGLTAGSVKG
jgi:N,N'-diacetylchitobiose transport system permease protein